MRLGTQVQNERLGTKYPFSDDSGFVSDVPYSTYSSDGKIPCDLFDDVVVDSNDKVSVFVTGINCDVGSVTLSITDDSGVVSATFDLDARSFDKHGRALYVSKSAFVRVSTKHVRNLRDVLARAKAGNDSVLSYAVGDVGFDIHCYRISERRLLAFDVHDEQVSGDVVLRTGYNMDIDLQDFTDDNTISLSASAGAGVGRVPCDVAYPDVSVDDGMSGLSPDKDGSIRIEADGCYSVVPMADNGVRLYGQCTQCCSCEGDYLPAALAVNNLIVRMNAIRGRLSEINDRHNQFIADTVASIGSFTAAPELAVVSRKSNGAKPGEYAVRTGFTFANMTSETCIITGLRFYVTTGGTKTTLFELSDASTIFRPFDEAETQQRLADKGILEISRTVQVGPYVHANQEAVLPSGGISIGPGLEFYVSSVTRGTTNTRKGLRVYNSETYSVKVSYRPDDHGSRAIEKTLTGTFSSE